MAEGSLTDEIVQLLQEKYLFNSIPQNFLDINDNSLVRIYLRLLTVYDEINRLVYDEEKAQILSYLRHILRCLRPLGFSYLAQNSKELLDRKKATRIITALHDKISSKYGKSLSPRVRQVIKKEKMSKTCSAIRKTINHVEESTLLSKPTVNGEDVHIPVENTEYPNLPFERIIPKGRQIPRTPLKTDESKVSAVEDKWKNPLPLVFPTAIAPPTMFKDSPTKEESMNTNNDFQNASAYVLTPPSEFCDSSFGSNDNTKSLESDFTGTPVSNDENESSVLVPSEKPPTLFNKRLTYCVNKDSADGGESYSSSETSLIEENDPITDDNANCAKSSLEYNDANTTKKLNGNVCCLPPGEVLNLQGEVGKTFFNKEPYISNPASGNRLPIVNKRRTYCIPKVPDITENEDENSKEDNFENMNNKRRTYVVLPNSRPCKTEEIIEDSVRECRGVEDTSDSKNKRKPNIIKDLGKCNKEIRPELNKTIDDLDTTANSKALFIDIIKNDISFIDRGDFPRGRELSRTPPSLNASFDPAQKIENLNRIGTPASSKFITIPESKAISKGYSGDTPELEKRIQNTTFEISSKESSYIFDDSLALFSCKKQMDEKMTNNNNLNEEKPAVDREKEADEDIIQNKVGRKTTRSRVAQVDSILSVENDDFNFLPSEKTEEVSKTRKAVSKEVCKVEESDSQSVIEQIQAEFVGENIIAQKEKYEQKAASESDPDLDDIESEASPDSQSVFIDDLESKTKNKGTRMVRKVKKKNMNLPNENDKSNTRELKTLESDESKSKLSQRKYQGKNIEPLLKTDSEDIEFQTKKRRAPKSKIKEVNKKNLTELETNVNTTICVKETSHNQQHENMESLENDESDLNESEEIFLKPNSEITKRLTQIKKKRIKKSDSSTSLPSIETENLISVRPVRGNRKQKQSYFETGNEEQKNVTKSNQLEGENAADNSFHVSTNKAKINNEPQRKSSRTKIRFVDSPQEKELEENKTFEEDIKPFNKVSNMEKTTQKEKPGILNKFPKVAMMIEMFDKKAKKDNEVKLRTETKRRKNSETETVNETITSNEFNIKDDEKDVKCKKRVNSQKKLVTKNNEENDVHGKAIKVEKDEIKSKTKGRREKKIDNKNKENIERSKVTSEDDQVIKSKSKPKQRRKKDETEYTNENKPKNSSDIDKKPLGEINNENKNINVKSENMEYQRQRPSRKCKSFAKLAITDMLSSPSD